MAVLNDIEIDVKTLCVQNRTTQEQIAKAGGTTGQYGNRVIHKEDGLINRTFINIMEALGYDIKLTYVPREP